MASVVTDQTPEPKMIRRPDSTALYEVDGGGVLPGFRLKINELFAAAARPG